LSGKFSILNIHATVKFYGLLSASCLLTCPSVYVLFIHIQSTSLRIIMYIIYVKLILYLLFLYKCESCYIYNRNTRRDKEHTGDVGVNGNIIMQWIIRK